MVILIAIKNKQFFGQKIKDIVCTLWTTFIFTITSATVDQFSFF